MVYNRIAKHLQILVQTIKQDGKGSLHIYIYIFIYYSIYILYIHVYISLSSPFFFIYIYTHVYIYIIFQKFIVSRKVWKNIFSNMFVYTEDDTESYKNIQNNNLQYKTHLKQQMQFPIIRFLCKNIFQQKRRRDIHSIFPLILMASLDFCFCFRICF